MTCSDNEHSWWNNPAAPVDPVDPAPPPVEEKLWW